MTDLTNTLRWLGDYKPTLPTEPTNFVVQNAVCCPNGQYLVSSYGWDYQTAVVDGVLYSVDGGLNTHTSRNGDGKEEDLTVMSDDPFEDVRNKLLWGSYGKSGKEPLHWIRLKDMEEEHIANVIQYLNDHCIEGPATKWRIEMMQEELRYRKLKLIGE